MSYFKFKKEARKDTLTHSKEDPEDQKIEREMIAEASRLAILLGNPEIKRALDASTSHLDCINLHAEAFIASVELSMILFEIIKNEASKEDGDTRLALMAHNYLNWIKDVTDKLNEVLSRVEAGTFPIADANELFIKAYKKFKEVELDVKSLS